MSISPCKFGRRDATLGQKQKGGLMLMKPPSAVDEMIHVSLHAVKTLIPRIAANASRGGIRAASLLTCFTDGGTFARR